METSALFAFLHHLCAFALVAALGIEFVLMRSELTLANARLLQRTDIVFGIAAGLIFVIGLLRVFYFEKGADYYFSNASFIAKLSLFVIVSLVSIVPTLEFLSWRKATAEGRVPTIEPKRVALMRRLIHIEMAGLVLIILCAVLMVRGIGSFN
jgi:putative membrane protein